MKIKMIARSDLRDMPLNSEFLSNKINDMIHLIEETREELRELINDTAQCLAEQDEKMKLLEAFLAEKSAFPKKIPKEGSWEWALEKMKEGKYIQRTNSVIPSVYFIKNDVVYLYNAIGEDFAIDVSFDKTIEFEICPISWNE